jgi:hypothetical protein
MHKYLFKILILQRHKKSIMFNLKLILTVSFDLIDYNYKLLH